MTPEQSKEILVAQVRSMILELDARLGDSNPWRTLSLDEYEVTDLASIKKLLHELLYAPPAKT